MPRKVQITKPPKKSESERALAQPTVDGVQDEVKDRQLWRDLVAYWILGMCNNYGYVVMLTAAHDIIKELGGGGTDSTKPANFQRECNHFSTGAILLADILPSLLIKVLAPFIPFMVNIRIFACCALSVAGFATVAVAETEAIAILGVVLTSLSSGLGESTFLGYSSRFNKNVISTWSSGTGGAGIAGALSYAVLTGVGLSSKNTLLVMIVVPVLEGAAFWGLLRSPKNPVALPEEKPSVSTDAEQTISEDEKPILTMTDKIMYIPHLFKYMVPLALVYFFEYFINQGLFELIYFPDIWLDKGTQYVWYQVDYQIGVFISRSSVNIVQIDAIWVMAVLQGLNVVFFTFEAIYSFTPSIWIIFVLIFFEGLLGGGAYVNTFYRMAKEIKDQARQQFAISIVVWSDAVGIALAGVAALPSHNAICTLAPRNRIKVA